MSALGYIVSGRNPISVYRVDVLTEEWPGQKRFLVVLEKWPITSVKGKCAGLPWNTPMIQGHQR